MRRSQSGVVGHSLITSFFFFLDRAIDAEIKNSIISPSIVDGDGDGDGAHDSHGSFLYPFLFIVFFSLLSFFHID